LNKVVFIRQGKYEKDESKHIEIYNVALPLNLSLAFVSAAKNTA
jgi:hypothetical protein